MRQRVRRGAVRSYVESLPVCSAHEVKRRLPAAGGYDCAISRPLSSQQLLRLEAHVQQPMAGILLRAPLTQDSCVMYTSSVYRLLHDGVHPVPMAFAAESVDFCVSLVDAPQVRIEILGEDASLFEMCSGKHVEHRSFEHIPDSWSDFIAMHRTAPHLSCLPRPDGAALEFQECTLAEGTLVTLVGELHRTAEGALSLRPWLAGAARGSHSPRERWRTSWEASSSCAQPRQPPPDDTETKIEKVLVSDDPCFFSTAGLSPWPAWPFCNHWLGSKTTREWSQRSARKGEKG